MLCSAVSLFLTGANTWGIGLDDPFACIYQTSQDETTEKRDLTKSLIHFGNDVCLFDRLPVEELRAVPLAVQRLRCLRRQDWRRGGEGRGERRGTRHRTENSKGR